MRTRTAWIALVVASAALASGCMGISVNSPMLQDKLKLISAGYTGCVPADNQISNLAPNPDGSGTWNATCKNKTYLCSTVSTVNSETYHCAPVAQ